MNEYINNSQDFKVEINALILENINNKNLEILLEDYHLYDISQVVTSLEDDSIKQFFQSISKDYAAEIFEYLDLDDSEKIIKIIGEVNSAKIISEMELDDAAELLKYLRKTGMRILKQIETNRKKELLEVMLYDEDEIGSYITDSFLTISVDCSVKEAMKTIISQAHDVDYISILYVVSKENVLMGYMKLKDLIVARAEESIQDIMKTRFPKIYPNDDKEYVATLMQETSESSIPVIDEDGRIEGIITHDDLMDIISLSQVEDYTKFAGLSDIEIDIDQITVKKSVKSRLPWLSILLGLSLITSVILSLFENNFSNTEGSRLLASKLAVYLPLILAMAGNTGTQSLAVMIRYLTRNQNPEKGIIKKHIFRELKTGFLQGFIIGIIIFFMINITNLIVIQEITSKNLVYALVTSGSIFIALLLSTTLGAIIPIIMTRFKIDPAVASGPFITTISDIITLSIYYSISMIILLPLFN